MKNLTLLPIAFLFVALTTQAGIPEDFAALKNAGRNLEDKGAICEEVARLNMQRQYGEGYTILSGIEYADQDGTVGELDVVAFENSTHQVSFIGEVKCWKDMPAGLIKAKEQRQRFLSYVRSSKELHFRWKDDHTISMTKEQFSKVTSFISIAQKGSKAVGYDIELPYTLLELMDLRKQIVNCQYSGSCQKPIH